MSNLSSSIHFSTSQRYPLSGGHKEGSSDIRHQGITGNKIIKFLVIV